MHQNPRRKQLLPRHRYQHMREDRDDARSRVRLQMPRSEQEKGCWETGVPARPDSHSSCRTTPSRLTYIELLTCLQLPQPSLAQNYFTPESWSEHQQHGSSVHVEFADAHVPRSFPFCTHRGTMSIWPSSTPLYSFCARALRVACADSTWEPVHGDSELVRGLIPANQSVDALVRGLPQEMQAIHVECLLVGGEGGSRDPSRKNDRCM